MKALYIWVEALQAMDTRALCLPIPVAHQHNALLKLDDTALILFLRQWLHPSTNDDHSLMSLRYLYSVMLAGLLFTEVLLPLWLQP